MPPTARDLLAGLQETLKTQGVDYDRIVEGFGQVRASEERAAGRVFGLGDHLRGLILAQLSNQRPWKPIADNMAALDELFLGYDPDRLRTVDPATLVAGLHRLRCGNRADAKQMGALAENIATLERIEARQGGLDGFVSSDSPDRVAQMLAKRGPHKLRHVGLALAFEYLKNVGVRASKPDMHVRRVIGGERLGYAAGYPSEQEAYAIIDELAAGAGCSPTYLDNLLWMFCAKGYGEVCRAEPRCGVCSFAPECAFPR